MMWFRKKNQPDRHGPLYAGRVYDDNGLLSYCSAGHPSRHAAVTVCAKARPKASRCMTSISLYDPVVHAHAPVNDGIEWIDFARARSKMDKSVPRIIDLLRDSARRYVRDLTPR